MPTTRMSLAVPIEARSSTRSKDSRMVNAFIEQDPLGITYAVKGRVHY